MEPTVLPVICYLTSPSHSHRLGLGVVGSVDGESTRRRTIMESGRETRVFYRTLVEMWRSNWRSGAHRSLTDWVTVFQRRGQRLLPVEWDGKLNERSLSVGVRRTREVVRPRSKTDSGIGIPWRKRRDRRRKEGSREWFSTSGLRGRIRDVNPLN